MSKERGFSADIAAEKEYEQMRLARRIIDLKNKEKKLNTNLVIAKNINDRNGIKIIEDRLAKIGAYFSENEGNAGLYWLVDQSCTTSKKTIFYQAQVANGLKRNEMLIKNAKNICGSCAISEQCRESILAKEHIDSQKHGVVGGMTFQERKAERIKRSKKQSS